MRFRQAFYRNYRFIIISKLCNIIIISKLCNTSGKNDGGKKRKKKGPTKQKEREKEGRREGEEDRMKNRKEKERKKRYLDKRNYCVGTEPSEYIGILVTSTITGHGGSVVSALD